MVLPFIMARRRQLVTWTPASLGSLIGWYKADEIEGAAGTIDTWPDLSGNGHDWTQATGALRPSTVDSVLNGKRIVRFAGHYLDTPTALWTGLTQGSLFSVTKKLNDPASSTARSAWHNFSNPNFNSGSHFPFTDGVLYAGFGTSSRKNYGNPTPSLASWRILSEHSAASNHRVYIDGTLFNSTGTNTVAFNTTDPRFGWINGSSGVATLDADTAEIIILNEVPSTDDRQKIEGYLAHRHGLASSLPVGHPYKGSPP